jgi:hypothetical protein
MSSLRLPLKILNWITVLLTVGYALVSLDATWFAEGDYRLGHGLPDESFSAALLPQLALQVVEAASMPAAAVALFIVPSMLLASRKRFGIAAAFAVSPYGLVAGLLCWVLVEPHR